MPEVLVCLVLLIKGLIEKMIEERALGSQFVPGCFQPGDGGGDIVSFDDDGDPV